MSITRLHSNERLSAAALFGQLLFLSGQVPTLARDIREQTREVLGKIDALLAEAGSDKASCSARPFISRTSPRISRR